MSYNSDLVSRLEDAISEIPILDVHTHLDADHLSARHLADVLLYHMVGCDLRSAGYPCGERVQQGEELTRIKEALPYLPYIVNTSCYYGVRVILRDLYGFAEPVTQDNWQRLDEKIRALSQDSDWGREILKRTNVQRAMTQHTQRRDGRYDDVLEYSFENTYFCSSVRGQPYDNPLRELEAAAGRSVASLDDVAEALQAYFAQIPYDLVYTTTGHLSGDIIYRLVTEDEMTEALGRRAKGELLPDDIHIFANYLLTAVLAEFDKQTGHIRFLFSLGAEPLADETGSRLNQDTVYQLADLFMRFPNVQFVCLLAAEHASQALCTVARQLPNLGFAAYWWHNFFPGAIRKLINDRLDMVALNKQIGFFSDAYCAEWVYGKAMIVRQELARVLGEKIERGQYTEETALSIARHLLWETPKTLVGMGMDL